MAWMKDNFLPRKLVGTLLSFLMDIHHMSVTLCFWILEMKTTLCLPSHSTHYLQPLDRSLFKYLKHYFHEACQTCVMSNEQRKITRLKFGQILSEDLGRSATACNGISGLKPLEFIRLTPHLSRNMHFPRFKDILPMKPDDFSRKHTLPSQSE
jgi:hypothetical protein